MSKVNSTRSVVKYVCRNQSTFFNTQTHYILRNQIWMIVALKGSSTWSKRDGSGKSDGLFTINIVVGSFLKAWYEKKL
jgi:hypothetical protein